MSQLISKAILRVTFLSSVLGTKCSMSDSYIAFVVPVPCRPGPGIRRRLNELVILLTPTQFKR
jgi:hypothetical protein